MYTGNLIFIALTLISWAGLYKIFAKAGIPGWKALIPFYNFFNWCKLVEKPWWWMFLFIVPGVNLLMYGILSFHTARHFGKRKPADLIIASILFYYYIPYLGFSANEKISGVADLKNQKPGFVKNWLDPLLFAVIAASVIRTFFLEAFTIPTSSLEKSLMVGDFLFVSKFSYGAKVPQTPLAFPFAHHTMPFSTTTKSYLEWIKLPYFRLPGFGKPEKNDIVVFNYPDGDTVALGAQDRSYYQLVRDYGYNNMRNPNFIPDGSNMPVGDIVARPPDKREHYVKRCVAVAGDKFEVRDGEIFINDVKTPMPEHAQHFYYVKTRGTLFGDRYQLNVKLLDKLDIYVTEAGCIRDTPDTAVYFLNMPADVAEKVKGMMDVVSVEKVNRPKGEYDASIFPHKSTYPWNNDNFGPLVIPKEGVTVTIDTANICLYDRVISVYDNNKLEIKNGKIFINGIETNSYTFKQDYYFMMGDNRHNSADSRSWGLVPYDHVVGKPVFVWFSMKDPEKNPVSGKGIISSLTKNSHDGKFRWERFFTVVGKDGLSKSYFIHFLIIVGLWYGYSTYRKRRKPKANSNTK